MSQPPTRNLIQIIFKNFINSLKPRQISGTLIGTDYFGNKYYEIPPNQSIGKSKRNRWFDPPEKENFEQELPAEWEAWLRGRRKEAPTEEEIMKNVAIMKLKKENAALLEVKYSKTKDEVVIPKTVKGLESFPKYEEYEIVAGKPRYKK